MTDLAVDETGLDPQRAEACRRVEELLAAHPPATTAHEVFWAARYDAGLAWVDFPVGLGGLGLPADVQSVVDDLLGEAGAPAPEVRNLVGVQMMAPTVAAFGTPAQQDRYLRRAFTCADIWCQLFSEPGAGSDLASLATRAERDGDRWVLNGQKVWTTLAHMADLAICIARTDPTVRKHAGLTFFVVDMHAPGVEVRPLRQISGEAEYNEVFLTDVVVPDDQRIGEPGQGWTITMATLTSERGIVGAMSRGSALEALFTRMRAAWNAADPSRRTAGRRDRLARRWGDALVVRLTAERADLPPSVNKITFGELSQRVGDLCLDLLGPAGTLIDTYELTQPSTFTHVGGDDEAGQHPAKAMLVAQALTIAGGTTNVNKNVLAERVLGLPPEPRSTR